MSEEIQQEEVRNEIAHLARADKLSGGQPTAETPGNAQHFNIAHDESHAADIHKNTGRPIAVLSEGAAASASFDPRPAPTKPFHPSLQPKDAKPETHAKQSDWGNWDPLDNPAVSHGFTSRSAYEDFMAEFALAARKKAIAERILPSVASQGFSPRSQYEAANAFNRASAEHPGQSKARGDPVHLHQLPNIFFLLVKLMWSKVVLSPLLFPPSQRHRLSLQAKRFQTKST